MTPVAAPTTAAPPADAVRAALADSVMREAMMRQVMSRLNKWLADKPLEIRRQEAEEVLSAAQTRAIEKAATFDPSRSDVGAWLHGVLIRVVCEHCRKYRKLPAQPPEDMDAAAPTVEYELPDEPGLVAQLDYLAPDDRKLVEWSVFDDLSHRQIAEKLKIKEGTARVRLHRILQKLDHKFRAERGEGRS